MTDNVATWKEGEGPMRLTARPLGIPREVTSRSGEGWWRQSRLPRSGPGSTPASWALRQVTQCDSRQQRPPHRAVVRGEKINVGKSLKQYLGSEKGYISVYKTTNKIKQRKQCNAFSRIRVILTRLMDSQLQGSLLNAAHLYVTEGEQCRRETRAIN